MGDDILRQSIKLEEAELKRINQTRDKCVSSIREKYRALVNTGDDAIECLVDYLRPDVNIIYSQIEEINDVNFLCLSVYGASLEQCYLVEKLAKELCGRFYKIGVEFEHEIYYISYEKKDCI